MNFRTVISTMTHAVLVAAAAAQPCGTPWTLWTGSGPPRSDFFNPSMAYDASRHKVITFGGYGVPPSSDTWEWDGAGAGTWVQRSTSGPSGRAGAALSYDSARSTFVLFGGAIGAVNSGETWEWDGVAAAWTLRSSTGPSPRFNGLMDYDAARGRTVLFGNAHAGTPLFDTWEWDGQTWSLASPSTASLIPMTMVYDSARTKMVLIGKDNLQQWGVWEWNGAVWGRTGVGGLPDSFSGHAAFDPVRGQTVLIGKAMGFNGAPGPFEFWHWDGFAWSLWYSSTVPVQNMTAGVNWWASYDGSGVLAFGSLSPSTPQTWRYSSLLSAGPVLTLAPLQSYQLVPEGSTVVYSAQAGTAAAYQWSRNGIPLIDGGHIAGATSPTLTISQASGADVGLYTIGATNACGTTTRGAVALAVACYANCDGSAVAPFLNANDFQCFLSKFAQGCSQPNCYSNCDGSTGAPNLTANDFQCFLNAYARGCP